MKGRWKRGALELDESSKEYRLSQRILCAMKHPDNPEPMFDFDAEKLSRHIAIRLLRANNE